MNISLDILIYKYPPPPQEWHFHQHIWIWSIWSFGGSKHLKLWTCTHRVHFGFVWSYSMYACFHVLIPTIFKCALSYRYRSLFVHCIFNLCSLYSDERHSYTTSKQLKVIFCPPNFLGAVLLFIPVCVCKINNKDLNRKSQASFSPLFPFFMLKLSSCK